MEEGHFHSHTRIVKRSDGRSAVAAAAYRAGEKLANEREGGFSDFSRRKGVLHTEIMAPDGAPDWVFDRKELWNRVEAREKHPRAQLAREVELALPSPLGKEGAIGLLRQYVNDQFVSRGMVADVAVHEGHSDPRNIHAHVLLTMRALQQDGFGNKVRDWNDLKNVRQWREAWATYQNRALADAGHRVRVDHRSYSDRGIDREPGIHEGPKVRRMKSRNYRPRSRRVERRSWSNRPTWRVDYRQIDHGRTRAQRNHVLRWRNHVHRTSGKRLARAVDAQISRSQFNQAVQQAREAGKRLRAAGKASRRAQWLERRADQLLKLHRERTSEILSVVFRSSNPSKALLEYAALRQAKLSAAQQRLKDRRATAAFARQQARRAAIQYRNLQSEIGGRRQDAARKRVAAAHEAALRNISRQDIRRSALSDAQKQSMLRSWEDTHQRSRSEHRSDR